METVYSNGWRKIKIFVNGKIVYVSAMINWEKTNGSNSALLRGALLVEAKTWLQARRETITNQREN